MSSTAGKPPLKDPARIPTAEDVDRHLNQFSRYARVVRGAARVAGLSTRLAWSNQGWMEQFRLEDPVLGEGVLGSLNLVRVPPVASIPVSRTLEEALAQRIIPEAVRVAVAKAEGSQVKWVELELTGPIPAETMAALIAMKTDLVKTGVVQLSAADRPKVTPRPEPEPIRPISKPAARPSRPSKTAAKASTKKPTKAKKPAAKKPAARVAKPAKKPAAKKAAKGKRR
ncbi:MAG: hypothetical protein JST54_04550 [Deltaproteobacteria bacterium]|nr:hypothetical protein [Deltaproteobacteria bacterium]